MKKILLEKIPAGLSQTGASQTRVRKWQRLILISFALIILAGGMTACGKRGEPYRPSEISTSDSY